MLQKRGLLDIYGVSILEGEDRVEKKLHTTRGLTARRQASLLNLFRSAYRANVIFLAELQQRTSRR